MAPVVFPPVISFTLLCNSPCGPAYYMLWFLAADYYSKLRYPSLYDRGGHSTEQGAAGIKEVECYLLPRRIGQGVFRVMFQGSIYLVGIIGVLGPVAIYADVCAAVIL